MLAARVTTGAAGVFQGDFLLKPNPCGETSKNFDGSISKPTHD